jgi:hypothetical protein
MTDNARWASLTRLANIIGIVMAVAAIGMIGRFAMLLRQAWEGHPRLIG